MCFLSVWITPASSRVLLCDNLDGQELGCRPQLAEARKLYLARYANSKNWVAFEDFSFYRMDVLFCLIEVLQNDGDKQKERNRRGALLSNYCPKTSFPVCPQPLDLYRPESP